eukprot:TRINITY_DN27353_c0_g1_i1.p1 TRINITY_DN27353_c0_g1~~TRINITY_DN27353_c0_g1_i1.p1  ORF type:complete len:444 (+),score=135.62 TRINITY_DN27353_c0_g1_i1:158-1489(+)
MCIRDSINAEYGKRSSEMISCISFLNHKGDVIIGRSYRDNVSTRLADEFKNKILLSKGECLPIQLLENASFVFIRHQKMYLVAITRSNCNAFLVLKFLTSIVEVFESFFGTLDEDSLRNNFVVIFELLDEMMDYGYPQYTDPQMLKMLITQESVRSEALARDVTVAATGVVSWRKQGIKHRKNQLYIDVHEEVNMLTSAKGQILRHDVSGKVLLNSKLSGMPECKFGLNDKIMLDKQATRAATRKGGSNSSIVLDDCTFDKCVRLGRFDSDRSISFVPPDGEFELMRYRVTEKVELPFKITPSIHTHGRTRIEITVTVKANFKADQEANKVQVTIPVPKTTSKCKFNKIAGKSKYDAEQNAVIWRIANFQGQQSESLTIFVDMAATVGDKVWARPPISMNFVVPMFTASQLKVMFLKVTDKSGYNTEKWVRYVTSAGTYQCRY